MGSTACCPQGAIVIRTFRLHLWGALMLSIFTYSRCERLCRESVINLNLTRALSPGGHSRYRSRKAFHKRDRKLVNYGSFYSELLIYGRNVKLSEPGWCVLSTDASTYAHFLFNAFDTDHNGSVSFEVSRVWSQCVR